MSGRPFDSDYVQQHNQGVQFDPGSTGGQSEGPNLPGIYGTNQNVWNEEVYLREPGGRRPGRVDFSYFINDDRPTTIGNAVQEYYTKNDFRGQIQPLLSRVYGMDEPQGGWGSPADGRYNGRWEDIVMASSRTGIPAVTLLRQLAENGELPQSGGRRGGGGGGGGARRIRPPVQLISDDDAEELIRNVAQNELGRVLSDDEEKVSRGIISSIRGQQTSEQNRVIDRQMAGGGSVQAPTNPQNIASQEVRDRFSEEREGYNIAQAFVEVMRLVGQGG